MIPALLGACVMGYVSTWENAKTLGRPSDEDTTEQKDVEMASIPNTSEEKKEPTESKTVVEMNNDDMTKDPVASVTPVDVNVQEYFCLFV